jgi:transposase-like protein
MRDWLEGLWHICGQKKGGSALDLQDAMGFGSYHTAWEWLHRMRRAMVLPGRSLLNGEVEVDETFIGGVKTGRRGRAAAGKSIVLVASEIRGVAHGRIRLQVVPDAKAATLEAALAGLVERGSNVVTDGWAGYYNLSARGYNHTVSRQTVNVGEQLLPHVDRIASLLKRWILGTHQGAIGHHRLQSYLDEFVFRFNRRRADSRGLLFHRLLIQVLQTGSVKRSQL